MIRFLTVAHIALIALLLCCSTASALTFANLGIETLTDAITIDDNRYRTGAWKTGVNTGFEDSEVEPGMETGQRWDLEGFFFDADTFTLTIIGGWNFEGTLQNYISGDIFLDIDGDATYGDGSSGLPEAIDPGAVGGNALLLQGFDYVIDVDWQTSRDDGDANTSGTYNIYQLGTQTTTGEGDYPNDRNLQGVAQNQNQTESNPWNFKNGQNYTATAINPNPLPYTSGEFDDNGFFQDSAEISGTRDSDKHYYASGFDLNFLKGLTLPNDPDFPVSSFIAHFTMECGNDNLMGQAGFSSDEPEPVPEPASMLLLGTGLIGLAAVGRKSLFRKK